MSFVDGSRIARVFVTVMGLGCDNTNRLIAKKTSLCQLIGLTGLTWLRVQDLPPPLGHETETIRIALLCLWARGLVLRLYR